MKSWNDILEKEILIEAAAENLAASLPIFSDAELINNEYYKLNTDNQNIITQAPVSFPNKKIYFSIYIKGHRQNIGKTIRWRSDSYISPSVTLSYHWQKLIGVINFSENSKIISLEAPIAISGPIYFKDFQVEEDFASSFIPNTRANEKLIIPKQTISPDNGAIMFNWRPLGNTTDIPILQIGEYYSKNSISLIFSKFNELKLFVRGNDSIGWALNRTIPGTGWYNQGESHRITLRWQDKNSFSLFANNSKLGSFTISDKIMTFGDIILGYNGNAFYGAEAFRDIKIFDYYLSDVEIQNNLLPSNYSPNEDRNLTYSVYGYKETLPINISSFNYQIIDNLVSWNSSGAGQISVQYKIDSSSWTNIENESSIQEDLTNKNEIRFRYFLNSENTSEADLVFSNFSFQMSLHQNQESTSKMKKIIFSPYRITETTREKTTGSKRFDFSLWRSSLLNRVKSSFTRKVAPDIYRTSNTLRSQFLSSQPIIHLLERTLSFFRTNEWETQRIPGGKVGDWGWLQEIHKFKVNKDRF